MHGVGTDTSFHMVASMCSVQLAQLAWNIRSSRIPQILPEVDLHSRTLKHPKPAQLSTKPVAIGLQCL